MAFLKHKIYGKLFSIFKVFPLKENKISFIIDSNQSFKGNLDYIKKEFERQGNFEFNFFYKDKISFNNFKNLATSKYVFLNDNFFPLAFMKFRDETEVVQLWHAPGASKKFGGSVCSPEELEVLSMASENTDYLITSSKNLEKEYVEAFQIDKSKIKALGLPRMDYYFENHDISDLKEEFCKRYDVGPDKKIILYLIAFCFYIGFILPSYHEFPVSSTVTFAERGINLDITFGYVGYFFAGYYLAHYDLKKWLKVGIYLLGLVGLISTIMITSVESLKQGTHYDLPYEYLTPNVFLMSIATFLLAKESLNPKNVSMRFKQILSELSTYSFGIYLVHVLIIFLLWKTGVTTVFVTPILSVPLLTFLIFCISYVCVKGMAQLPFVKRFIL